MGGSINHQIYCSSLSLLKNIYIDLITGKDFGGGKCRILESLAAGQQIKQNMKENV